MAATLLTRDAALAVSHENVEIVARVVELFEKGDLVEIIREGLLAQDVQWHPATELAGMADTYEGSGGFVEMMQAWTENFDGYTFSMGHLREVGDLVLATGRQTAFGMGSGVPVEMKFSMLFAVRNAAVSDVRVYLSEEDAVQAAGAARIPRGEEEWLLT